MQLHIETEHNTRTRKFWLYEPGHGKDTFYSYNSCNGLVVHDVSQFEALPMEPFLTLPVTFADEFMKLLVEHATKKGINTEKESKLEGRLEATAAHLADMQAIAKKLLKMD